MQGLRENLVGLAAWIAYFSFLGFWVVSSAEISNMNILFGIFSVSDLKEKKKKGKEINPVL